MASTDQVQDAKDQAQEKAQEAKAKASDQVRTQVAQRSTQAGEQIGQQASDIRAVGDQLREQGKDGPAKLADQAADRAEQVGSYLRDKDADTILHDVEDFARKQPMAVIAGGLALGFAASRFLRASSSERYTGRVEGGRAPSSNGGPAQRELPAPSAPLGASNPDGIPPLGEV